MAGLQVDAAGDSDEERLCVECGRDFVSLRALFSHMRHAHGRRDPARDKLTGSVCPACGSEFWMRDRLLRHVRTVPSCRVVVLGLPDLAPHVAAEQDAVGREHLRSNRRAGRHMLAGPPVVRPPPAEREDGEEPSHQVG